MVDDLGYLDQLHLHSVRKKKNIKVGGASEFRSSIAFSKQLPFIMYKLTRVCFNDFPLNSSESESFEDRSLTLEPSVPAVVESV